MGERAITEQAILIQASQTATIRSESDLASVVRAIRGVAAADIEAFCGACMYRGVDAACRFRKAANELARCR